MESNEINGILWNSMETYGILWDPMDSYGNCKENDTFLGFLWKLHGNQWLPMEIVRNQWNPIVSYRKGKGIPVEMVRESLESCGLLRK